RFIMTSLEGSFARSRSRGPYVLLLALALTLLGALDGSRSRAEAQCRQLSDVEKFVLARGGRWLNVDDPQFGAFRFLHSSQGGCPSVLFDASPANLHGELVPSDDGALAALVDLGVLFNGGSVPVVLKFHAVERFDLYFRVEVWDFRSTIAAPASEFILMHESQLRGGF
ncbi:MAG: hypothetical protein ABW252_10905, partial [Polyangiales bacterium]